MDTTDIILAILISAIWVVPFAYEMITGFIDDHKRSVQERKLMQSLGRRKACIDCKYCKKYKYRPFYGSTAFSYDLPSYCSKFRIKLNKDVNQHCVSMIPEFAERTENEQKK